MQNKQPLLCSVFEYRDEFLKLFNQRIPLVGVGIVSRNISILDNNVMLNMYCTFGARAGITTDSAQAIVFTIPFDCEYADLNEFENRIDKFMSRQGAKISKNVPIIIVGIGSDNNGKARRLRDIAERHNVKYSISDSEDSFLHGIAGEINLGLKASLIQIANIEEQKKQLIDAAGRLTHMCSVLNNRIKELFPRVEKMMESAKGCSISTEDLKRLRQDVFALQEKINKLQEEAMALNNVLKDDFRGCFKFRFNEKQTQVDRIKSNVLKLKEEIDTLGQKISLQEGQLKKIEEINKQISEAVNLLREMDKELDSPRNFNAS